MKVAILIRSAPYGMATSGEAFRAVIGLAGMGVETLAILVEDGVFVGLKKQDPSSIGMHNLLHAYSQIPEFGGKIYMHKESMEERGVNEDDIGIACEFINTEELKKLINSLNHVITFS